LGHLAEVGAPAALPSVAIHRSRKSGADIHEARLVCNFKPKATQVFREGLATRRKRDLREQPKGMEKSRVI
jgi:hypothetical protein